MVFTSLEVDLIKSLGLGNIVAGAAGGKNQGSQTPTSGTVDLSSCADTFH